MDEIYPSTSAGMCMAGRPMKTSGPAEDAQVKMARNRFKSVLKHMVQEQCMQDEDTDSDNEDNIYKYKNNRAGTGLSLPPQKRHKSGNGDAAKVKTQPAFVMKLFDRGVDLAQFNDMTPLYPICRAWIQNKPHASRQRRETEELPIAPEELEYRADTGDIYCMVPPDQLPCDEYGNQISYRVPPPLQRSEADEPFDINYHDIDAPSPAILFQNHLDRWNVIRNRWKEASAYNESRYGDSFAILRTIYEQNRPEDPAVSVAGGGEENQM